MEIKGQVHCLFEQSGAFKNEFIKLGIPAQDYDIQNNFNETDYVIDLFAEIEKGYEGKESIFDNITKDDLIIAFFPCIYFTGSSNPLEFSLYTHTTLSVPERIKKIINRSKNREYFYELLLKMAHIVYERNLRLIFENPFNPLSYLDNNFLFAPQVYDKNRTLRGDYFVKPTGYWFLNCENTTGYSYQQPKEHKKIRELPSAKGDGLCSEERSMISSDYARNFICDFILGKEQDFGQMKLL